MKSSGGTSPSPSSPGTAGNYVATSVAAGLLGPNESRASALDRARARLHQNAAAQAAETPSPHAQAAAAKAGTITAVANEPTIAERTDLPALELNDPSTVGVDIAPAPSGSESSPVQHSPKATIAASANPSTPSPSKASPLQFIKAATASKAAPDEQARLHQQRSLLRRRELLRKLFIGTPDTQEAADHRLALLSNNSL